MVQLRQGVQSTNTKTVQQQIPSPSSDNSPLPYTKSNELHMHMVHIIKLYTDETGRYPIKARRGNQYLMVAYNCYSKKVW